MKSILITGASSGIGAALAKYYAREGAILHLCARNESRLRIIAKECDGAQAIHLHIGDVTDRAAIRQWIEECDVQAPLDLVVVNAGISGGGSEEQDRQLFEINLTGVLNTLHPALDCMLTRTTGTIALMSSIAGNRGLPGAAAYSASKAAVLAYGEGLRGTLSASGIHVCVICPGFVRSRITDQNSFPMPFFMEPGQAATLIANGLRKNRAKISFPWQMRAIGWILRILPSGLGTRLLSLLPRKAE
jgi:short-subunit dehydrogenase